MEERCLVLEVDKLLREVYIHDIGYNRLRNYNTTTLSVLFEDGNIP